MRTRTSLVPVAQSCKYATGSAALQSLFQLSKNAAERVHWAGSFCFAIR